MAKEKKAEPAADAGAPAPDVAPTDASGHDLQTIPAKGLRAWTDLNPRRRFDPERQAELVASIRAHGVREPLLVHDNWAAPVEGLDHMHRFWVVAGERRLRAALELGPDTRVPCLVGRYTPELALEIALVENLERADLTAIEEARGYQRLLELPGMTQRGLADRLGRAQPTIANAIRLLQLPDEVLYLVEVGNLEPSHARDCLLPFAKIPEGKRTKLFAEIVKVVRQDAKEGGAHAGYQGDQFRALVAQSAQRLSRPIAGAEYDDNRPLFDAKEHEACTCAGPKFQYASWGHATVRCFDDDWWKAAQAAAKKRIVEEAREREKKLEAASDAAPARMMTRAAFEKVYGWNGGTKLEVSSRDYGLPTLLDAAELAGAPIVGVKDAIAGPTAYCVDEDAVKRAKAACTRERNRLLKERREARATRYLQEAARVELEPWMLAEILSERPQNDQLLAVAREIGIDVGKHGEVHGNLKKLPAEHVLTFFKVLALRSRNKELGFQDPIEREVDRQLVARYAPGIAALRRRALAEPGKEGPERVAEADVDAAEAISSAFENLSTAYDAATEAEDESASLKALRSALDQVHALLREHEVESPTPEEQDLIAAVDDLLEDEDAAGDDAAAAAECRCVKCGCTDSHACPSGCSWTLAYQEEGIGVCDACETDAMAAGRLIDAHRRAQAEEMVA